MMGLAPGHVPLSVTGTDWPGLSHLLPPGNEADMGLGPSPPAFISSCFFQFLTLVSVFSWPTASRASQPHVFLAPGEKWPHPRGVFWIDLGLSVGSKVDSGDASSDRRRQCGV